MSSLEGGAEVRHIAILGKSSPGIEKNQCKGPEARPRKSDKARVAGSEGDWR